MAPRETGDKQVGRGVAYGAIPGVKKQDTVGDERRAVASCSGDERGGRCLTTLWFTKVLMAACVVATVSAVAVVVVARSWRSKGACGGSKRGWDAVIVGGGPSGSVVARALSDDPTRCVLLLEAGGAYRGTPERAALLKSALASRWSSSEDAASGHDDDLSPMDVPRLWADVARHADLHWPIFEALVAKTLGGCGAHNAMLYVRALPYDLKRWAWRAADWDTVEQTYTRLERYYQEESEEDGTREYGLDGPITTRRAPGLDGDQLAQKWLDTAAATGRFRVVSDFNAPSARSTGNVAGPYHFNIRADGRRASAYAALLEPVLHRPNLRVVSSATVERVVIEEHEGGRNRTEGVLYATTGEPIIMARASLVVLCAGALNTPQLLKASGVTRKGVGRNLQDHPAIAVSFSLGAESRILFNKKQLAERWKKYATNENGESFFASPGLSVGAFAHSAHSQEQEGVPPDLQFTLFAPGQAEPHDSPTQFESRRDNAVVTVALLHPEARHALDFGTDGKRAQILIGGAPSSTNGSWVTREDAKKLVVGIRIIQELARTPPLSTEARLIEPWPAHNGVPDDELLEAWVTSSALPNSHWCGTARLGDEDDEDAVVDHDLRVHGVDGLRVADASVMPHIPNGNVHSTVLVIASVAADLITRQWQQEADKL